MARPTIVRVSLAVALTIFLLILLVSVHISAVTSKKKTDPHVLVMARLDIKQAISQTDAQLITTWLYQQKGVDHVFVNPDSKIAVFTFFPLIADADQIALHFSASLPYKAQRFRPDSGALRSGCPAGFAKPALSITTYIKQLF